MNPTPQEAKEAVKRVLAEVSREHEAAYAVIAEAVRVCGSSGMGRKETAQFLGVPARRIDRRGQYFRSLRGTRDLFRGANDARRLDSPSESVDVIIQRAWKMEAGRQALNHI
jgi:hypothetical protein